MALGRYLADAARVTYNEYEDVGHNILLPRLKFAFEATLSFNDHISGKNSTLFLSRIASITMPSHNVKVETLNQYNIKRNIQTGVEYNPVVLEAYDTRDGQIEKFLKRYNDYYYFNVMKDATERDGRYDVSPVGHGGREAFIGGTSAGYALPDDKQYITEIEIRRVSSDFDVNKIKLINPMVERVETDTLDYSDSQPVKYRITFAYENYQISTNDGGAPDPSQINPPVGGR